MIIYPINYYFYLSKLIRIITFKKYFLRYTKHPRLFLFLFFFFRIPLNRIFKEGGPGSDAGIEI